MGIVPTQQALPIPPGHLDERAPLMPDLLGQGRVGGEEVLTEGGLEVAGQAEAPPEVALIPDVHVDETSQPPSAVELGPPVVGLGGEGPRLVAVDPTDLVGDGRVEGAAEAVVEEGGPDDDHVVVVPGLGDGPPDHLAVVHTEEGVALLVLHLVVDAALVAHVRLEQDDVPPIHRQRGGLPPGGSGQAEACLRQGIELGPEGRLVGQIQRTKVGTYVGEADRGAVRNRPGQAGRRGCGACEEGDG